MNAEPKHGALFALKVEVEVELEAECHSPTDRRARGILRSYVFCTLRPVGGAGDFLADSMTAVGRNYPFAMLADSCR